MCSARAYQTYAGKYGLLMHDITMESSAKFILCMNSPFMNRLISFPCMSFCEVPQRHTRQSFDIDHLTSM